jgi:asparagine synthetase B (glutamine-hydrolysing)
VFQFWEYLLLRRGPDKLNKHVISEHVSQITFLSSVLHLRGDFTPQPIIDQSGNILIWNGEIFGGIDVPDDQNDGLILSFELSKCNEDDIPKLMSRIDGPWSFAYWKPETKTLWFGRDRLGRRSLLVSYNNFRFAISSVAINHPDFDWEEVTTSGIYSINFNTSNNNLYSSGTITHYPYSMYGENVRSKSLVYPENENPNWDDLAVLFYDQLYLSIKKRLVRPRKDQREVRVGVLFSGGIDSSVIAYIIGQLLPPDEPVDLINVAFSTNVCFFIC